VRSSALSLLASARHGLQQDRRGCPNRGLCPGRPSERGSISEQITADATLAPLAQAAISPKVTAPVKKFFVQRGSHVKAGQLLATLENSDLEAAALDNKGAYTAAQGTPTTSPRGHRSRRRGQGGAGPDPGARQPEPGAEHCRQPQPALCPGSDPRPRSGYRQSGLVQAKAAYEIAKQHLEAVQKISRKAALESAQGQLTSAQGKYLGAEAQLSYTEIRSPISGVVTDRPLFAGETAAAGTPVITVMDTSALLAKLHLAQIQAQQLSNGRIGQHRRSRARRSRAGEGLAHQPRARPGKHYGRSVAAH
jgi:HlyD family secretion protein